MKDNKAQQSSEVIIEKTDNVVDRAAAPDLLHVYKPLRPGQIRSEPWLSNVL